MKDHTQRRLSQDLLPPWQIPNPADLVVREGLETSTQEQYHVQLRDSSNLGERHGWAELSETSVQRKKAGRTPSGFSEDASSAGSGGRIHRSWEIRGERTLFRRKEQKRRRLNTGGMGSFLRCAATYIYDSFNRLLNTATARLDEDGTEAWRRRRQRDFKIGKIRDRLKRLV